MIGLLEDDRIPGIIGPRRTGKTTIMYQLIDALIKEIDPMRILFFSIDDPSLLLYKDNLFENMKYNIKFVISSSSATHISKKSRESLVGRIFEILLLPLSFRDFAALQGKSAISGYYQDMDMLDINKIPGIELLKFEEECKLLFNKYLLYGGFPEAIQKENILLWQEKLVSDVLRKVLFCDLAELYNVRIPSKLEELFVNIAANTSETFSYSSLSRNLGIGIEAVINYA